MRLGVVPTHHHQCQLRVSRFWSIYQPGGMTPPYRMLVLLRPGLDQICPASYRWACESIGQWIYEGSKSAPNRVCCDRTRVKNRPWAIALNNNQDLLLAPSASGIRTPQEHLTGPHFTTYSEDELHNNLAEARLHCRSWHSGLNFLLWKLARAFRNLLLSETCNVGCKPVTTFCQLNDLYCHQCDGWF